MSPAHFFLRVKGDREARGLTEAPKEKEDDKKKKKKKVAVTAVKLDDEVVKEIEFTLAQVSRRFRFLIQGKWPLVAFAES